MGTRMQELLGRARDELRYEPLAWRVRAVAAGTTVLDSTRALLVWEPRRVVPSYAVPVADVRAPLSPAPANDASAEGVLHPGIPFAVHTAAGESLSIGDGASAGFRLADAPLEDYVVLDFRAFDAWFEEDEQVTSHPRDPFHRVDARRSTRSLRIELAGQLVAETTRAVVLSETSLPTRFYLPREDVRPMLLPSARRTVCPYKGEASYWSVDVGGRREEDLGWSYEQPLPELAAIAGRIAFWDERVDVFLDGERRERPGGAVAAALRDEFGVRAR